MKTRLLSIIALAAGLALGGAYAAEGTPGPAASGPKPTKEQRAEARKKRQAEMKAAQKKGEVTTGAEAKQDPAAPRKKVTAATKAERAAKRAEMTKENKAGEMPATNEAGTVKK
jgi:hypothetical protein